MRISKAQILRRVYAIPEIRFEDQRLSSYSGLVVIQQLFKRLGLRRRLSGCFQHLTNTAVVGFPVVALLLIVHLMLGFRRLREMERYEDDPVVLRALGLRRLPDVCTISRRLAQADRQSVCNLRA